MQKGFKLGIGFDRNNTQITLSILDGRNYSVLLYGAAGSGVSNEVEYIYNRLGTIMKRENGGVLLIDGTGYGEMEIWGKQYSVPKARLTSMYSLTRLGENSSDVAAAIDRFKLDVTRRYSLLREMNCKTWIEYNMNCSDKMTPLVLFIHGIGGLAETPEWSEIKSNLEIMYKIIRACGVLLFINASNTDINTLSFLADNSTSVICLRSNKEASLAITDSELPSKIIEKAGFAYCYNKIEDSMFKFQTGAVDNGKLGHYNIKSVIEFIPA